MRSRRDLRASFAVVILGVVLAVGSTGCTVFGLVMGAQVPRMSEVRRGELDEALAKGRDEVQLTLREVPERAPDHVLAGVFVSSGPGEIYVRDAARTWKVRLEHVQRIEVLGPEGWRETMLLDLESRPGDEPEVRISLLRPSEGQTTAEWGTDYRLRGRVVDRARGELLVRNEAGTWRVRDRDVLAIEVETGTRWLQGAAIGLLVDVGAVVIILVTCDPNKFFCG